MLPRAHAKGRWHFLLGVVLGTALTSCFAGKSPDSDSLPQPDREMSFGGVKLTLRQMDFPADMPALKEGLTVYRNDVPIALFFLDEAKEIVGYGIVDGDRKIVRATFGDDRLSTFTIYGSQGTPAMFANASENSDDWDCVRYVKMTHEYDANERLIGYRPLGEMYIDIDRDGQFDAKDVYNDKSERLSQWVFIDGAWKCLGLFDPPKDWRQPGYYSVSEHKAVYMKNNEEYHLDFVPRIGWKERLGIKGGILGTDPITP